MDEKTLYFELLREMENIVGKHKRSQRENMDFDPIANIPVEPPENIANPEEFTPIGSLKTSIVGLYRKSLNEN